MVSSEELSALYEEPTSSRIVQSFKRTPYMYIGIAGFVLTVGRGLYGIKQRGKLPISLYLIHMRVKAQAMIAGACGIGVTAKLVNDYVLSPKKKEENKPLE